jgi:hypothetical protein
VTRRPGGPRYIASGWSGSNRKHNFPQFFCCGICICGHVIWLPWKLVYSAVPWQRPSLILHDSCLERTCHSMINVLVSSFRPETSSHHVVFEHPVALIYNSFHIYFRLKCNLLFNDPSTSLYVSAVYGHHQISSILLKLLYCM